MTEAQLLQLVYAHIGGEEETGQIKPVVLAKAQLAMKDFVEFLVERKPEQAEKFRTSLVAQSYSGGIYTAPTNLLYKNQKQFTRIEVSSDLAFQVESKEKLYLITGSSLRMYYALEGDKFYFSPTGVFAGSGSDLNISYIKVPTISDLNLITDELIPEFLNFVFLRIAPPNEQKQPNKPNSQQN